MCLETSHLPPHTLTFLASLLPGSVDVVLELNADLPLCGLVTDEGKLQQLLRWWAAQVSLDETRVNEVDELLRPGNDSGSARRAPLEGGFRVGRGENIPSKANCISLLSSHPNKCPQCNANPLPKPLL